MDRDPEVWATLGKAIRSDRERQGLTRGDLVDRIVKQGGRVSTRTIGTLESGAVPERGIKRPALAPTVRALGWGPGWADRILDGEDVGSVLGEHARRGDDSPSPRETALELLPAVYEFGRTAVAAGADPQLRDEFESIVQQMIASTPSGLDQPGAPTYELAAYRPHAVGDGVPDDDASRIAAAMGRDS